MALAKLNIQIEGILFLHRDNENTMLHFQKFKINFTRVSNHISLCTFQVISTQFIEMVLCVTQQKKIQGGI